MEPQLIGPFIVAHVAALVFVLAAWRWPRGTRYVAGAGFLLAGAFNVWLASTSAVTYVAAFGPHAIPIYRRFIYDTFARHTAAIVLAIATGQLAVGVLAFAPLPWRRLSYLGAILFLLAITPLGMGAAAPSTLIFAAGFALLFRERRASR
jgi:hypothetical protein